MIDGRLSPRSLLIAAAIAALALSAPALARANDIATADPWPGGGGNVSLTVPLDGQQVYSVPLEAGDWFVAYAWAPDTQSPAASITLYDPTASEVASPSIDASSATGILFWQAPVEGVYHVSFGDAVLPVITHGMFTSRPTLTVTTSRAVVVPYNGAVTLRGRLADSLYTYVAYDGPALCYEPVTLMRSTNGASWKAVSSHLTDFNGDVSRTVTGLTRKASFVFNYGGNLYDTSAFGECRSLTVTVTPQVLFTQKAPAIAKAGTAFTVSGTLRPTCPTGPSKTVIVQARRIGGTTSKVYQFSVRALPRKAGSSPLRASVRLPKGTWAVHFYHREDATNAKTSTRWLRVVVK